MTTVSTYAIAAALSAAMQDTLSGDPDTDLQRSIRRGGIAMAATRIADALQMDNPDFDRGAFLSRAGVSELHGSLARVPECPCDWHHAVTEECERCGHWHEEHIHPCDNDPDGSYCEACLGNDAPLAYHVYVDAQIVSVEHTA